MRTVLGLSFLLLTFVTSSARADDRASGSPVLSEAELSGLIELDRLERERDAAPLEGPAVLTLTGALLFAGGGVACVLLAAAGMASVGEWGGAPRDSTAYDVGSALGIASTVAGLFSLVLGAIWWGVNDGQRGRLTERIEELEVRLEPTLTVGADGATLGLAGSY